ncbi:MAG: IMPACT family protein [Chlorobi bacterium]|nr:IMPACT family protein [Chlorobiota bacterium]
MSETTILYYTLSGESRQEVAVKDSRFIATAVPIVSKEDALVHVERVRQVFPNATHHCYAYRIGPGGLEYRAWDDGEPSGSAGKPILFVIQKHRLSDILVVVTRYFGGKKLGIGPLARAYAHATEKVLALAERIPVVRYRRVRVFCSYPDVDAVAALLRRHALDFDAEYRDAVEFDARIREAALDAFAIELSDVTSGRAGFIIVEQS